MHTNQRYLVRKLVSSGLVCLLISGALRADNSATQPTIRVPHNELKKLAWQLAVPAATFTDKSVFEVIELLHAHDIHHLELAPGQTLSAEMPSIKIGESLPEDAAALLLAKLKSVHMDIVSYGPVEFGIDDQANRNMFWFAKKIKAKNILATVPSGEMEQVDKLATEFNITVAVRDGGYKTPGDLLTALQGWSARIGGDGDFAKWADAVSAARLLHGHLIQLRIQQVKPDVIAEMRTQAFKGVVVIVVAPGGGQATVDSLVDSVNRLSDALQATAK